jgi:ubiquinone/menaquinone biosynthesis C-methylase UbiE
MQRVLEAEVMDTAEEAAAYVAMDHSAPNTAFVDRLMELRARGLMLDLGTGPGQIPRMVCDRLEDVRVVGLDLSWEMLRVARTDAEALAGGRGAMWWLMGNVKRLPFADGSFDTVFSNTILHHIPDPGAMLIEAVRVLRRDGVLLIRDLYRPADEGRLDELVRQHAGACAIEQQMLFRASLLAALTPEELSRHCADLDLPGLEITVDSDRHVSVQRGAMPR